MRRMLVAGLSLVVIVAHLITASAQTEGWTIPANAAEEKSPLQVTPDILTKGKSLFGSNCERCHGPEGIGDGPNRDPAQPPANLADAARGAMNPEGVLFYKVANGRARTPMPAFKSRLTRTEIWMIVEYIKTLRQSK